jgi:hypothetical protein
MGIRQDGHDVGCFRIGVAVEDLLGAHARSWSTPDGWMHGFWHQLMLELMHILG